MEEANLLLINKVHNEEKKYLQIERVEMVRDKQPFFKQNTETEMKLSKTLIEYSATLFSLLRKGSQAIYA